MCRVIHHAPNSPFFPSQSWDQAGLTKICTKKWEWFSWAISKAAAAYDVSRLKATAQAERAILILGGSDPSDAALAGAKRYAEVYVLARSVPDGGSPYLIDAGRAEANAQRRLRRVAAILRARGSRTSGLVGDADPHAARRDAIALFPQPSVLLEAA